jgi:hypothetical protein
MDELRVREIVREEIAVAGLRVDYAALVQKIRDGLDRTEEAAARLTKFQELQLRPRVEWDVTDHSKIARSDYAFRIWRGLPSRARRRYLEGR